MGRSVLTQLDTAFRRATERLRTPPTRFFLNLTERCQLRCAHCITHAPTRTADGSARTMSEAVLDALTPHLAHAHYVGLTHAGEPTLAPLLDPLLERLRRARRGRATVVHVVTNGMALTERRFEQLARAGITSWSFSLDGATPQTNDALRLGAKVVVLKQRLAAFSALRQREALDVRLGVSCTLTRSNVHEVERVAHLVAEAGLDWLKLEETFPVNARGEREVISDAAVVEAAVGRAKAVCDATGVRLVDHTKDRQVWKCRPPVMSEDDAAFSAADDFANRCDINPCRAPWEVVCVEPDGAVKPGDFHQPAVGSLLDADLLSLWNATPLLRRRAYSAAHRRCEGMPTCRADPGPRRW
ncbi:MAG: radical SAM protein [Myxococcaceae bacterium]|nr:radical SAM protein [Myxococcaceae bacterium]